MTDFYHISYEPIESLVCHPDNSNVGDVDTIRASIRRFGWVGMVVVQKSTGYTLAHNNSLVAAAAEGIETVPVLWVDLDDDAAARFMVAHNLTRQQAQVDDTKIVDILAKLDSFTGTGFTYLDYENLKGVFADDDHGFLDDDGADDQLEKQQPPQGFESKPVQISVGPYRFSVDSAVYDDFYSYLMESGDFLSATSKVAGRLGFTLG